jgi:CHAT domain-containing protein/tetratricopeptide (TPR) repeat protein
LIAAFLALAPLAWGHDPLAGRDFAAPSDEAAFRSRLSALLAAKTAAIAAPAFLEELVERAEAVARETRSDAPARILAHMLSFSPSQASTVLECDERLRVGISCLAEGDLPAARAALSEALDASRRAQAPYVGGRAERLLGDLSLVEGNAGLAEAHYEQAAGLARALDLCVAEMAALEGLADARARRGSDWRTPLSQVESLGRHLREEERSSGERCRIRLARILLAREEPAEAIQVLDGCLERPAPRRAETRRAEVLALLGQAALQDLDFERARSLLSEARDGLASDPTSAANLVAEVEMGLAHVSIWRGEFEEAERCAVRAASSSRPGAPIADDARLIRFRALYLMGRYDAALALARDAGSREILDPERRSIWLLDEAIAVRRLRREEEAAAILGDLLEEPSFASSARTGVPARVELAAIRLAQGRADEAEELARSAIASAELRLEDERPGVALDFALHRWPYGAFEIGIAAAVTSDRTAEAFELAERSKARGFLAEMGRYGPDAIRGASRDEKERWFGALRRCRELAASLAGTRNLLDAERVRAQLDRASEDLAACVRRAQATAIGEEGGPSPASTEAARSRLLGDDRILLEYFLGEERSFLFVLEKDEAVAIELGNSTEISRAVRELTDALRGASRSPRLRAALEAAARRATDLVLPAGAAGRVAGREVYVVPDGPLFGLPFEALLDPEDRALGETTTFAYGFSAGLLVSMSRHPLRLEDGILLVGDPEGEESGRLLHAREEVEAIRARFPGERETVLLGRDFTRAALFARREPVGVLHLATHTVGPRERVGLRVSGVGREGILWCEEAFQIGGSPDLVVLSGCATARGEYVRGLGVRGFLYPFLFAGATRAVASLWPVEDESVPSFMGEFYGALAQTRSVPLALARARAPFAPGARAENLPLYYSFLAYGPF